MRMMIALSALLLAACSRTPGVPPSPPEPAAAQHSAVDPLTAETWLRSDPGAAPGDLLVFLSGGSLLMSSCGEPYRLARWQREGDGLVWDEDGEPIRARVVAVDAETLKLEFQLRGGAETKSYRASREARVCPDLPR